MAPLGTFDPDLCPACWFDTSIELAGWFDPDFIVCAGAVVQPAGGLWPRPRKPNLRFDLRYEYEPEGGLVFSGSAICQQGRVLRRMDYVPQIGRAGVLAGSALVEPIQQRSAAYSGSGGLCWGGEAEVSSVQQILDAVGDGGFQFGGEAITEHR